MTKTLDHTRDTLVARLKAMAPVAVAVSGGVDSMTLAAVAHDALGGQASMLHAVSPAVPDDATQRVRRYADQFGWQLNVLDAGEFLDSRYMANPANRCFFCKTNLYSTMAATTESTLVSGTNTDDLGDYRPGLQAASDHQVLHPYVEADIDKATVRLLAAHYNLHDVAELPAAPCLSSRIETGIRIDPAVLAAVNQVERELRDRLKPKTARCRVRQQGIEIQLDRLTLDDAGLTTDTAIRADWTTRVTDIFTRLAPAEALRDVSFAEYKMGSAFLTRIKQSH